MKKLKEGDYYINIANSSLRSVNNDEDFTDMIDDFSKFSYLGIDINGDTIRLINSPIKGFIFVRYPSADGKFIRLNEILKNKEEETMDKKKMFMTEELKPTERIRNLALVVEVLQDSGFCHSLEDNSREKQHL